MWDRFVRLFHWSVVALFVVAFLTPDAFETLHQASGYGILALVLMRLVWGFVGPAHARFRAFIAAPSIIAGFLLASLRLKAPRYIGHNPAGGAMVTALLAILLVITLSGIAQTFDAFATLRWIEPLHKLSVFAALGLIALHLVGVMIASIEHAENLVAAMFSGKKRAPDAPAHTSPVNRSIP